MQWAQNSDESKPKNTSVALDQHAVLEHVWNALGLCWIRCCQTVRMDWSSNVNWCWKIGRAAPAITICFLHFFNNCSNPTRRYQRRKCCFKKTRYSAILTRYGTVSYTAIFLHAIFCTSSGILLDSNNYIVRNTITQMFCPSMKYVIC